jgi:nucleotide-binding universal stress UspA family protein
MGHHWRRICCPVDFSDSSRSTLMEAAVLAARSNAVLVILHVYERPALRSAGEILVSDPELEDRLAHEVNVQLDRLRADAEPIAPGRVSAEARCGDPSTEIVRFAEHGEFDAIVMGKHGASGLQRLVVGSVTDSVIRRAPCTVVIVRAQRQRVEPD